MGLRPLPPASLSKYFYYYEYKYVIGLPPSAAVPFHWLSCGLAKRVRHIFYRALGFALAASLFELLSRSSLLACGRAKRVCETFGRIVYRAFELGLRPLPPASLSKYSYYYELPCGLRSLCDTSSTERWVSPLPPPSLICCHDIRCMHVVVRSGCAKLLDAV